MPRRDNQPLGRPRRDSARWIIGIARESIRVKQARLRLPAKPDKTSCSPPLEFRIMGWLRCYAPIVTRMPDPWPNNVGTHRSLHPVPGTPCPLHFVRPRRNFSPPRLASTFAAAPALLITPRNALFALT